MFLRSRLTFLCFATLLTLTTATSEIAGASKAAGAERSGRVSAAQPRTPEGNDCILKGTVVNSVTGEPIRNALVQVTLDKTRSTLTQTDGSFQFRGLPEGTASVSARKPGFFNEPDVHPLSRGLQRVVVAPDAPPVTLKLVPEAVIFGTVLDEYGEPVEGMNVGLIRISMSTGRKTMEHQAEVNTDELGKYRFAELLPGTYYLSASKWLDSAETARATGTRLRTKGYPTEYYPGVTDLNAAAPIKIVSGKQMQMDLSVAEKSLCRVTGSITGYSEKQGADIQLMDATGALLNVTPEFDPVAGRFQFVGLPQGSYTIRANAVDNSGESRAAVRQVNVSSDVTNLNLHLAGTSNIPVVVRKEFSHGQPDENSLQTLAPANIQLVARDGWKETQPGSDLIAIQGDASPGQTAIVNVEPGTYTAQVQPTWGHVYSATYGSIDLLREDLTIDADAPAQTIEVVLRDDGANLAGTLTSRGQRTSGAVLLVPARAPKLLRLEAADSNGNFQFSNLAPGNYTVVGLDLVDDVEYRDADFLKKYLPLGQEITLSADQSAVVQLERVEVRE